MQCFDMLVAAPDWGRSETPTHPHPVTSLEQSAPAIFILDNKTGYVAYNPSWVFDTLFKRTTGLLKGRNSEKSYH